MVFKNFLLFCPIFVVFCTTKSMAQYAPPGVNPQLYQQQQQVNSK